MISGLSHITFIVRDLDRMEVLLTSVLGARKVYDSGDKTFSLSNERFFVVGELWLAIMEGDPQLAAKVLVLSMHFESAYAARAPQTEARERGR